MKPALRSLLKSLLTADLSCTHDAAWVGSERVHFGLVEKLIKLGALDPVSPSRFVLSDTGRQLAQAHPA